MDMDDASDSKSNVGEYIGRRVEIYWPRDKAWYPGVLHSFNPDTGLYSLLYDDTETEQVRHLLDLLRLISIVRIIGKSSTVCEISEAYISG